MKARVVKQKKERKGILGRGYSIGKKPEQSGACSDKGLYGEVVSDGSREVGRGQIKKGPL